MRIPKMTLIGLALAALVPGTAAAKHGQPNTFERTFPAESRLCAMVAAGHVPMPLQGDEAQVTAACTALHAAYDAAVSAATGAAPTTDANKTAMADALAQVQAACGPDATDMEACGQALEQARVALHSARHDNRDAKHAFRQAIETARHAFRDALRPLKHGPVGAERPHSNDHPSGGDDNASDAPTGTPAAPTTDA